MARYLGIAYVANFIGCMLVVFLVYFSGVINDDLAQVMISCASGKVSLSIPEAVCRGILCSILVNLASWIAFSSDHLSGKILGLFFPTMLFYLCGFEQSITNMFFIPAGMLLDSNITVLGFLHNLIPVTIGNIIGGVLIVGVGYWSAFVKDN